MTKRFSATDLEQVMPVEYWFKQINGEPMAVTAIVRLRGWGTAFAHRNLDGRWVADNEPQGVHHEIAERVEEILNG